MKHRWMFGLAMLLAGTGAAHAADEVEVVWPLPWSEGTSLVYDEAYTTVNRRGEVTMTVSGTGTTEIGIAQAGADGFLQRWTSTDLSVDVSELPAEAGAVIEAASRALGGIALDVRLDAEGAFLDLDNLDTVQPLYRDALLEMFSGMVASVPQDASAEVEARARKVADQLSVPAVLAAQLTENPLAYNFVAGGGLVPGKEYVFEDEGENPLNGEPMPRTNTLLLTRAADAPGAYDLRWRVVPEPEALKQALTSAVRTMFADDPEVVAAAGEPFADGVDFSTTVDYRIDAKTGIVQRMRRVTIKRFADRDERETNTLTLRE